MTQLLLIPTDLEWRLLKPGLQRVSEAKDDAGGDWEQGQVRLCGFGPIVSAARTAALICELRPHLVVLVGIAGALSDALELGRAYEFSRIAVDGLGVGRDCTVATGGDANYLSSDQMGWAQWPGSVDSPRIGDRIDLWHGGDGPASHSPASPHRDLGLLSVCAASADRAHADRRRERYADMAAEDMEGFGVAAACELAGIPLRVIRGISNRAGDRNASGWRIESALAAVCQLLHESGPPAVASPAASQAGRGKTNR
jgi:futalosine hydrolase